MASTELKPRVILKTHTGVRRPGIFSVLVARCTSPTNPGNQTTIARRLAIEFKHVPSKDLGGVKLGERGAAFHVVWMARPQQLGFLTSNLFWSWKGHVLRALSHADEYDDPREFLQLNPAERLIFLKYYLEGDGAILIALAQELVSRGQLTERDLVRTDLLEERLQDIWSQYLKITTHISERVGIRRRLQQQRYDPTTRRHKTYPHLAPLEDMGLVVRDKVEGLDVFYPLVVDGRSLLKRLVEGFPSVWDLETSIARGEHYAVIAGAICAKYRRPSLQNDTPAITKAIAKSYHTLGVNGVVLHSIDAIADLCFAKMLCADGLLVTRKDIDQNLTSLQSEYAKEVRFHVDRLGRPAYVVISNELIDELRLA